MKILVTGMSGRIGSAVRRRMEGNHQMYALNRRDVPGVPTTRADIADLDAIRPAFTGMDAVVHMAAGFESEGNDRMLLSNLTGSYNIFEASREAGVKRVVYASSGRVISNYERDEPYKAIVEGRYDEVPANFPVIDHLAQVRPESLYGCTKLWGEALARYYSETFDMSCIVIRVGYVNDEVMANSTRGFSHWSSQRDIAQLVERCVEAPDDLRFDIFFGTSGNKWNYRDIEHARNMVGYAPEDNAEAFR